MLLTKQEAIRLHREMWNWIAEQYKEASKMKEEMIKTGKDLYVGDLKNIYLEQNGFGEICCECFCCEYAKQKKNNDNINDIRCCKCPLVWNVEGSEGWDVFSCEDERASWYKLRNMTNDAIVFVDLDEAYRLAKQIAELEER